MNDPRSPLGRIAPSAAVILMVLATAGCAKKVTDIDASYTAPEGQLSADARLIVYPDAPVTVLTYRDVNSDGPRQFTGDPKEDDILLRTEQIRVAPGALHGLIMDGTPASGYQVLRRESNGGYAQLKDYVLTPVTSFLDSHWEAYTFDDARPSGFNPPSYTGRGVVTRTVTATSPLTNASELVMSSDIPNLEYTGNTGMNVRNTTEGPLPDSNLAMQWKSVPDAAGYWIQIHQFTGNAEAQVQAAAPAPFIPFNVRNYFVGYVAAPATEYKLGESGALVLMRRTLMNNVEYLVRISAVNDHGEMIAFTRGDWQHIDTDSTFRNYRVGAIKVTPRPL
jgi:hypothetical protein